MPTLKLQQICNQTQLQMPICIGEEIPIISLQEIQSWKVSGNTNIELKQDLSQKWSGIT